MPSEHAPKATDQCEGPGPLGGGTFIQFHPGYPVCLFGCRVEVVIDILKPADVFTVEFLITLKDGGVATCAPGLVTNIPPNGSPHGGFHFYFNCNGCSGETYTVIALARNAALELLEVISADTGPCP